MIRFEYRTEVLTSMVGRDKLRVADRAVAGIQEQILADVPQRERAIVIEGMRAVMNRLSGEV